MTIQRLKFEHSVTVEASDVSSALRAVNVQICCEDCVACCNKSPSVVGNGHDILPEGETSLMDRVWAELNGIYLPRKFTITEYSSQEIQSLQDEVFADLSHAKRFPTAHSDVSNIVASNLNHFAQSGIKTFGGVVFSTFEAFKFTQSLSYESAYRLAQASLAKTLPTDAPFLQIHKAGDPPKTKADALFLQYYLTKHRAGQPGALSRITLFRGAPYLLSIVLPETAEALDMTHAVNESTSLAPKPTSQYLGSYEDAL